MNKQWSWCLVYCTVFFIYNFYQVWRIQSLITILLWYFNFILLLPRLCWYVCMLSELDNEKAIVVIQLSTVEIFSLHDKYHLTGTMTSKLFTAQLWKYKRHGCVHRHATNPSPSLRACAMFSSSDPSGAGPPSVSYWMPDVSFSVSSSEWIAEKFKS